ncbi:MAG: glycerol-3-phosphate dehydrogenase/oxidase [Chloroflexi bacterium]|nr:glycerol-3-phosphate dehydrogenase/oxidase [Chloroflexota bacterium]
MSRTRAAGLRMLATDRFDLLVVGGGIVGAGIARDAALRGLKVALVEQRDLSSGTTSRPTRLIHGGLRYLESLDLGLVRSDLREREVLLRIAPHLVSPLPFLLPGYGRNLLDEVKLRAGMALYDLLSFDKSLPGCAWLPRDEVLAAEPTLAADGLRGAWRFYDAQVPLVERLVVENALDATSYGAVVANYARADQFLRDPTGRVTGARVRDARGGGQYDVRAALTVNATGPWLDLTTRELNTTRRPLLRLTRGVHLVTPSGSRNAHVLFARSDGRLFFVIPWLGYSLVGTTDTDYFGDPASVAADAQDVAYLVGEARRAFPSAAFDQVHYTWAGVRALNRVEGVPEGQVSRRHALLDHERSEGVAGVVSVVGGKITAYRAIAEEVVSLVARKLGRQTQPSTDRRPLPGGRFADLAAFTRSELEPRARALELAPATVAHLAQVYGSLADEVLDLVEQDSALGTRLCPHQPAIRAQLVRATQDEWAMTLGDFLLRRSSLGLAACQGLECVDRLAEQMGDLLGWDATDRAEHVSAYRAEIEPMRRFSTTSVSEAAHA